MFKPFPNQKHQEPSAEAVALAGRGAAYRSLKRFPEACEFVELYHLVYWMWLLLGTIAGNCFSSRVWDCYMAAISRCVQLIHFSGESNFGGTVLEVQFII